MTHRHKPQFNPKVLLGKIDKGRTLAVYAKNHTVFTQGDPADAVFNLQRGKVQLSVVSSHGKEAVIGLLGPGDFFGEGCLAGQPTRMATATTISESSIVRLDRSSMVRLLNEEPDFSEIFLSHLLSRNIRLEDDLIDQLFNSSEQRLARVLLQLANVGKEGKVEAVIPKISQEMLAKIVGTTRSRVSMFMNKFRKMGLIEYNGKLKVHSSLLNVILRE